MAHFGASFLVVAVGLGRIFIYVRIGLDGFWSVLVGVLGRGGWFGSSLYIRRCRARQFWSVLVCFGVYFGSRRLVWVEIFIYIGAGLDGFGRFWSAFWVVAVGFGRYAVSLAGGLDGFGHGQVGIATA